MKEIHYIQQPTEYLCGQACVAMIANVSVDDVIRVMKVQSYLELFVD